MASIFPEIEVPPLSQQENAGIEYTKEMVFSFTDEEFILENGRPKVVEGIEALKVWIEKTIRTAKFRFKIYEGYGCELEDIIGRDLRDLPRAVLESEVPRVIREALIVDDRIAEVRDFVIERGDDWLKIAFTIDTALDDTFQQEVIL